MPIGLFDSGFGGLSVFKAVTAVLPEHDFVYLGDSARAPYGNHSRDVIYTYVEQAVRYLFEQENCPLVILACNTASAAALRKLQQEWLPAHFPDRRVLGVIRPIAEAVGKAGRGKKIGVIGTRATIASKSYTREIEAQLADNADVLEQACPLLVPLIEEGFHKRPEMKRILKHYLRPLKQANVQVLINGCTHYQLLHETIAAIMGKRVTIIDTAEVVANALKDYLARHPETDGKIAKSASRRFLTTDTNNRFNDLASQFYGQPVKAQRVDIVSRRSA